MPLKIRVSNRTAHLLGIALTLGLGITSLYIAFFVSTATKQETMFLIVASIGHFYFFKKTSNYEVDLWGWSLSTIIWAVPTYYSIWMIIKYLL